MKKINNIGIFGGSFDPVHFGHLQLAHAALKSLKLDKVIFVPANQPPHKRNLSSEAPFKRLHMLRLALKTEPNISVSSFEINRKTTTYTYQTLLHFKKLYPKSKLYFLLGTDSLNDLVNWKNIEQLNKLCTFIAGKRKGFYLKIPSFLGNNVELLTASISNVSSTRIRKNILNGKSIANLVPGSVNSYIAKNRLYE